ncbi:MAG: HD domain-containing protein [Desulfobacterales bacterium]|nr:HD domain-containing protein [Desulfobacterales bacterium]
MDAITIDFPVHTLDNRQLLPAGATLTEETMTRLGEKGSAESRETSVLLNHGAVRDDIQRYLAQPPYQVIFSDHDRIASLLRIMGSVRTARPVLDSLDYFKSNDPYTYRHFLMVFALTTLLSDVVLSDRRDLIQGLAAGPMHDFGKICVPIEILTKTVPLTLDEWKHLRHHTAAGWVLLTYYLGDARGLAARAARDHHERRNGSGYPRGVHLKDQVLEIIMVSDLYDALLSPRPYRIDAYDNRTALEELTAMSERGQLSWRIVKALIAHNREKKPGVGGCMISRERRTDPPDNNLYGVIEDD